MAKRSSLGSPSIEDLQQVGGNKSFPLRMSYHCFVCPKNLSFSAISLIAFFCVCMFWSHSIEFCQDEDQRDLVHGLVWEK